ncbi:MAG: haloacid dehalogenase [Gemmataceae bacterium]
METVVFLDLDDTIFQTRPNCPPNTHLHPGARDRGNAVVSYMTEKQRCFFEWLDTTTTLIPTTARNTDAFRRVELSFSHVAIVTFGAVILGPDGQPDTKWLNRVRPQLEETGRDVYRIYDALGDYLAKSKSPVRIRTISDQHIPCYVVLKPPPGRADYLDQVEAECLSQLDLYQFRVYRNHVNISIVPKCIGKASAVRYVLEEYFTEQQVLTLGVGDSLSDLPFLRECDFLMMPRQSQLTQHLAKDHSK